LEENKPANATKVPVNPKWRAGGGRNFVRKRAGKIGVSGARIYMDKGPTNSRHVKKKVGVQSECGPQLQGNLV